jgi:N,N'-diacetyllegionaminate synthase
MSRSFSLASGRRIGDGAPCFVIAEAGINHNGQLDVARRLIEAAATAGADAVKFQTFSAERLVTPGAAKAEYQARTTGSAESQLDMLRRVELTPADFARLRDHARECGITFLSTPFEEASVDVLMDLGVELIKVPSGEITNLPFLSHVGRTRKPVILSTGMSTLDDVLAATTALRDAGTTDLVVLQCVSEYPAAVSDANLRVMATLRDAVGVPVGFSDHTLGLLVPQAAVALGACVIEKHLTLDRRMEGPDHAASIEPDEFKDLVRSIRQIESALGNGVKAPTPGERGVAAVARKSVVALVAIPAGTILDATLVGLRRPGTGLPASKLPDILGRPARVHIAAGTLLEESLLA